MKGDILPAIKGVGIDIVEIRRFKKFTKDAGHHFLKKVFSEDELAYCFSYKAPDIHLAALFAAKEAASKALGTTAFPFIELEIRHKKNGAPEVYKDGKKLSVKISITHTDSFAAAVAVV